MPTQKSKPRKTQKLQPISKGLSGKQLLSINPTTASEKSLVPLSNSRLEDFAACPTWGHVHSRKRYSMAGRSMALECGETMHRMFAAVRMWQLWRLQSLRGHSMAVGSRVFGQKNWANILSRAELPAPSERDRNPSDLRDELLNLCFAVLHLSGWENDPKDEIRTMGNMELATIAYVDERFRFLDNWPVWVADKKNKNCQIGIEQVFDVVLTYADGYKLRYVGTVDGLHLNARNGNALTLEDNKTAARMDVGWRQSWAMKHQMTGYMACSTSVFGFPVFSGTVWGLKIKQTQTGDNCLPIPIKRDYNAVVKWGSDVRWILENLRDPFDHQYGFEDAPRFTHSCNRYFRPCALLPFCADTPEGRIAAYEHNMVPADPSPSERAVLEV